MPPFEEYGPEPGCTSLYMVASTTSPLHRVRVEARSFHQKAEPQAWYWTALRGVRAG